MFCSCPLFFTITKKMLTQSTQQGRSKSVSEVWSYVKLEKFTQTHRTHIRALNFAEGQKVRNLASIFHRKSGITFDAL